MSEAAPSWIDANQRHLVAAIGEVRDALARHAGEEVRARTPVDGEPGPAPSALEILCARFGLSPFERALLLFCAGVELDAAFARLCAAATPEHGRPTFAVALAALPDAHWSAITPGAPLRHWHLVEFPEPRPASLLTAPLRIDERILHYLTGIQQLDERLVPVVDAVDTIGDGGLAPSHEQIAARVAALSAEEPVVVQLCGRDAIASRQVAAAACRALHLHLLSVDAANIPAGAAELLIFARLCDRESLLSGSAVFVDATELDAADASAARPLLRLAERLAAPLFIASRDGVRSLRRATRRYDVVRPTREEQLATWTRELGPVAARLNGELPRLAAQFDLGTAGIAAAAAEARANVGEGAAPASAVWEAGRARTRPALESLAHRIVPVARRRDLVLPETHLRQLDAIAAQVEHRATVYDTWGLGRASRGLGVTALFAGPSGTGKTFAAEVLAGELGLDLYAVDLSSVVNKYIGETEKNLSRVFDAAEDGGAILFFDEADALFGKRAEVRDSHDRYANIEINYLLQRMESYRGLAVLATNRKGDLDPAFTRRIRFILNFPFPDPAARAELWRRAFPETVPRDELDVPALSRLDLTGGSIRNVALGAAFRAAAAGGRVRMEHVLEAARVEQAKLDRAVGG
jgi:hypothetical protein